ncbi:pectate lyase superfamily protein [Phage DSL-LC05]|nr:pectate lyase superfamily protein [Phage DSL-LC05]
MPAVSLSPVAGAGWQFFDNNGNPLSGGKLFTYAAGTTTNQATYTSSSGNTAHTNPIVLDSAGRVSGGEVWLTNGQRYKFVLKTSAEVQLWSADNVSGINDFSSLQPIIYNATGDGTTVAFTLASAPVSENTTQVYVSGVYQQKNTYSVAGVTLTFSEAPPLNATIEMSYT